MGSDQSVTAPYHVYIDHVGYKVWACAQQSSDGDALECSIGTKLLWTRGLLVKNVRWWYKVVMDAWQHRNTPPQAGERRSRTSLDLSTKNCSVGKALVKVSASCSAEAM